MLIRAHNKQKKVLQVENDKQYKSILSVLSIPCFRMCKMAIQLASLLAHVKKTHHVEHNS